MNFISPARQNSIKTPEDDLLDILVAIRLYLLFLDDTDIPLRRLPLADSSRQKAWALPRISMGRIGSFLRGISYFIAIDQEKSFPRGRLF